MTGPLRDRLPGSDVVCGIEEDPIRLQQAAVVEQNIWLEKGYGSLSDYRDHLERARTFTAFDPEGCVGVTRLFHGLAASLPPFLDLPFDDEQERDRLVTACRQGRSEEVGTVAVVPAHRSEGHVSVYLWRLAYRDAVARGVRWWGIIMEPRRVRAMNRLYGFTFSRLGAAEDYQGGLCAAHLMDLRAAERSMHEHHRELWQWFTQEPLAN